MAPDLLVKVVITTHNRRKWAARAIESVLAQTHPAIYVVIVDDASGDGTAELAQSYAAAEPDRVTVIRKSQNRGLADSIRLGLQAEPDAPYVAILNDDDQWHPQKLTRQLELFERNSALGLVCCEAQIFDEDDHLTGELFSDLFGKSDRLDFEELLSGNCACASTLLFTRDLAAIARASIPEPSMVTDYYLMLLAAGYFRVGSVAEPLALYRTSTKSMHTDTEGMWRDTTRARMELFARHPQLVERVGGPRAARRRVALSALYVAIYRLRHRAWREYAWQSWAVLRQRSVRPTIWLVIHTLRALPALLAHRQASRTRAQ
jgi:glycosyltransferase involved in cell wall biosynthesis